MSSLTADVTGLDETDLDEGRVGAMGVITIPPEKRPGNGLNEARDTDAPPAPAVVGMDELTPLGRLEEEHVKEAANISEVVTKSSSESDSIWKVAVANFLFDIARFAQRNPEVCWFVEVVRVEVGIKIGGSAHDLNTKTNKVIRRSADPAKQ